MDYVFTFPILDLGWRFTLEKNVPCNLRKGLERGRPTKKRRQERGRSSKAAGPPSATGGCGWRLGQGGVGAA